MSTASDLVAKAAVPQPNAAAIPKRKTFWRLLFSNKLALIGFIFIVGWTLIAILSSWIVPHDPYVTDPANKLLPPSAEHWFGTDNYGRDILSRVIYGARISIWTGMIAVSISFIIGVPLGAIAGFYGGRMGSIIMRCMDILLAFPSLVLAMAIAAYHGTRTDERTYRRGDCRHTRIRQTDSRTNHFSAGKGVC